MNSTLKALQLKAKHQVYTLLSGHNLSSLHGEGYDFSELREYQVGDDIRKINWMITAKLGRPYIKEFHANRELSVVVATLMDGSLYFGESNAKQQKLTEITTMLGYAAQQQNDLFTGLAYCPSETYYTPPTKELYHIEQFSQKLFEMDLLQSSLKVDTAIDDLFQKIHKPSLLFIVSDFLQEIDLSILAQKHEVIALIIRDEKEEIPTKLGEVNLTNPTGQENIETYFGQKNITQYLSKLKEHDQKLLDHFSQHTIRSVKIRTDENALSKLIQLFSS